MHEVYDVEIPAVLWAIALVVVVSIFIITACVKYEQSASALFLYWQMQLEGVIADGFTYISILGAFNDQQSLDQGKGIHACIIASGFHEGAVVLTALINMYGKCGSPKIARIAFDAMSWNSMIAAYAHHGHPKEALQLYDQIKQNRVTLTDMTFLSVLRACSTLEALTDGKDIHADIIDGGFGSHLVSTALISMYGRELRLDVEMKASFSNKLITSPMSTFGYVAQGMAGIKPWILARVENGEIPSPTCSQALSMDPCFHAPYFDYDGNKGGDTTKVLPYVQQCEDVDWGLKVFPKTIS